MSDNAEPYFCRSRPIPHALRGKVELELQRLVEQGVIEPVEVSEWAAPIVPIVKPDGTVQICGDYRLTINRTAKPDTYPLPRVEDLFATLSGGISFTKLDLAHAYSQTRYRFNATSCSQLMHTRVRGGRTHVCKGKYSRT